MRDDLTTLRCVLLLLPVAVALLVLLTIRAARAQSGLAAIVYGQTVEGQISSAQPEAGFVFTAAQGDVVLIDALALDETLDPFLTLLDGVQARALAADDNGGGGMNARLRHMILVPGRYVIRVAARRGTGRFALSLGRAEGVLGAPADGLRMAPLQATQQGLLGKAIPFVLYPFHAEAGQALRFESETEATLKVELAIYDGGLGERYASAEPGAPLDWQAPARGLFFVIVSRAEGAGMYTLSLENAALNPLPASPLDYPPLVPGQPQEAEYGNGPGRVFRFGGRAGLAARLDLITLAGDGGAVVVADQTWRQISPTNASTPEIVLPDSKVFYAVVLRGSPPTASSTSPGGQFALTLTAANRPATPTPLPTPQIVPIQYGITLDGQIAAGTDRALFAFRGSAGEAIRVRISGRVPLGLYVYRYQEGQTGPELLARSGEGQIDGLVLPAAGPYLLVVAAPGGKPAEGAIPFTLMLSRL
jgi:hypothetical protein